MRSVMLFVPTTVGASSQDVAQVMRIGIFGQGLKLLMFSLSRIKITGTRVTMNAGLRSCLKKGVSILSRMGCCWIALYIAISIITLFL